MTAFNRRHRDRTLHAPCRLVTGNIAKSGMVLIEYENGERQWWHHTDIMMLENFDKQFIYEMTSAALQLGDAPPYTLWPLKVRVYLDMPQIGITTWNKRKQTSVLTWYDFEKDTGRNPPIQGYKGQRVVGITSDWRLRQ